MKYYPEGTKVYVAPCNCQHGPQFMHLGDFLVTNKAAEEPLKLYCEVKDFDPHPQATIIEDLELKEADGPLSGVHNAREQLKEALAKGHGEDINAARMAVDKAELALRKYWDARRDDDTKQPNAEKAMA